MWWRTSPHQTQSKLASASPSFVASLTLNSSREPTAPWPTSSPAPPPAAPPLPPVGRRVHAHDAPARPDRLGQPDGVEPGAAADVEAARALGQMEVGDEGPPLRLREEVHPLQRFREGLGLGLGHESSRLAEGIASDCPRLWTA